MRKKSRLTIIVLLLGGGFLLYGFFSGELPRIVRNYFSASLSTVDNSSLTATSTDTIYNPKYSFSEDDDNDGLSNAKEVIYGADPTNPDTDGDGYPDGEEVKNGYDPTRAGNVPLEERFKENDTIRYFSWAQKKTGNDDPRLDNELILEFLNENVETEIRLDDISIESVTAVNETGKEAVDAYFKALNETPLPNSTLSYAEVARNIVLDDDTSKLDAVLDEIRASHADYKKVVPPAPALEIHTSYLKFFTVLETLFQDLYDIHKDPIKLSVNLYKGAQLILILKNIQEQSMALQQSYLTSE